MSRIDELMAELAPEGVRYVELAQLFDLRNGYTPSKSNASFWSGGTVPWFRMEDIRANGGVLDHAMQQIPDVAVKGGRIFPANSLLVATSATIGEHALVTVPHLSNQRFTSLSIKSGYIQQVDMKFIYYYGFVLDEWCRNNTTTSSFASVDMSGFKKFKFPVPPLEVQREIVRTLDQFTQLEAELEAELQAELEARRQQYAYYSELLLTPRDVVRTAALGDLLLEVIDHRGKTPKKLGGDWTTEGHRVVSAINFKRGGIDNNDHHYISEEIFAKWMKVPLYPGDVLLTSEAPLGSVAIIESPVDWAIGQRVFGLRPDPSFLHSRYLFHLLRAGAPRNELLARSTGSTVSGIRRAELVKVSVNLPTLAEQERVADVLDNFASLVGDLRVGLPAELMARRKQYWCYRDKLLTFPEASA